VASTVAEQHVRNPAVPLRDVLCGPVSLRTLAIRLTTRSPAPSWAPPGGWNLPVTSRPGAAAHGGVKGGPEGRPEGMRAPESTEERSTLDAGGGRSYGAPEGGPGGSSRIAASNEHRQLHPRNRVARPIRDEGAGRQGTGSTQRTARGPKASSSTLGVWSIGRSTGTRPSAALWRRGGRFRPHQPRRRRRFGIRCERRHYQAAAARRPL
jgi:hypothetical protein